ncbi:lipoprotein [Oenococcus oeni S23]|nr:lipoprotein [Oenococcus oeni]KEP88681.1 hypothetical protein X279_00150 [Oenococcus oeni IOEB_0501]KGH52867.1 lipoprotein [Oenococcus oeni S11]KGH57183.1 lipoprotein [Oenococcus oeni IOEB_B10]KGH67652.1 lipoprotein [Oenococcus oeni IOEB_9517]KGH74272.1 lipoprotein [Oenococcus oeni IOEB_0608]KGH81445.1 lipoprotein [Oenococcus oeni S14]KGH82987.1 lipoprotein [Oenococcus oeni S15]KGH85264.1 lipoprotein [Oenococcus oeni IOEB_VF]KGH88507.1 lipoprotein [Oenococcus oeni S12]KGH91846.1 lipopro
MVILECWLWLIISQGLGNEINFASLKYKKSVSKSFYVRQYIQR